MINKFWAVRTPWLRYLIEKGWRDFITVVWLQFYLLNEKSNNGQPKKQNIFQSIQRHGFNMAQLDKRQNQSLLHIALGYVNGPMVIEALCNTEARRHINRINSHGSTPLQVCLNFTCKEWVVQNIAVLLKYGADPRIGVATTRSALQTLRRWKGLRVPVDQQDGRNVADVILKMFEDRGMSIDEHQENKCWPT